MANATVGCGEFGPKGPCEHQWTAPGRTAGNCFCIRCGALSWPVGGPSIDVRDQRIAELEAEVAELRKDREVFAELVRVIEADDVPGYVYDAEWTDCCACGEGAATSAVIAHGADCFQWALEKARDALARGPVRPASGV